MKLELGQIIIPKYVSNEVFIKENTVTVLAKSWVWGDSQTKLEAKGLGNRSDWNNLYSLGTTNMLATKIRHVKKENERVMP